MATQKPIKKGSIPEPPNPCAEPGRFIVRGKAWFDEHGQVLIDEDGDIPWDISLDLSYGPFGHVFQCEDFIYEESAYRKDAVTLRAKATPRYQLRWCPVAKEPKQTRKRKKAKLR